ncbi:MAG: FtsB family cell division protein [Candidatus Paceibacteria bacterium]
MKDFQNKRKTSVLYSLPILALFCVILVIFALGIFDFAKKAQDAYQNKKIAEQRILELTERKQKLEADLGELGSDLGKERVFRENYGLGKPGEQVIVIVDGEESVNSEVPKASFFDYIKDLFE